MAVTHPYVTKSVRHTPKPLHPIVGLAGGFGFIIAMALAVHMIFGLVV